MARGWIRYIRWMVAALWCAASAAPATTYIPPEPVDYTQVDFYLHTIEVGNLIYDNFGHTAIRVHDRMNQQDMIYNWGIFDFSDPLTFSFRFFKGILNYKLGIYPYQLAMRIYREEQRTVWEDKLNLTVDQKKLLMKRLIWNAQPENLTYAYQYFFDNCSTRPRDYINEALEGSLKDFYEGKATGLTFRDMVWSHYASVPFVAMSLDILMNGRIDAEMSTWQQMFLPKTLRDGLIKFPVGLVGEPGQELVGESNVLVRFPAPKPWLLNGYVWFWIFMAGPIVFGWRSLWQAKKDFMQTPFWYRWVGWTMMVYGFYFGLCGSLMLVSWLFSAHLDLHHNANLALFWPTDLGLVYIGWHLWRSKGHLLADREWFSSLVRRYAELHLLIAAVLVGIAVFGRVEQSLGRVFLMVLPWHAWLWVGLSLGWWLRSAEQEA